MDPYGPPKMTQNGRGPVVGPFWTIFGPFWGVLAKFWAVLGPFWAVLSGVLTYLGSGCMGWGCFGVFLGGWGGRLMAGWGGGRLQVLSTFFRPGTGH